MPPRNLRRGGNQFAASVVGILNSTSTSDKEARKNIVKVYLPLLCLVCLFDLGCALSMLYIQCGSGNVDNDKDESEGEWTSLNQCVRYQMMHGFSNASRDNGSDDQSSLGDLFWLALIRCIVTSVLLYIGVRFGKFQKKDSSSSTNQVEANENNENNEEDVCTIIRNDIGEAVTSQSSSAATQKNEGSQNSNIRSRNGTHETSLTTPLLMNREEGKEEGREQDAISNENHQAGELFSENPLTLGSSANNTEACEARHTNNSINHTSWKKWFDFEPTNIKNTSLVLLFLTSTVFQLYAGIRVSTFHSTSINPALPTLMCLTILWINIMSYIFRVLLEELTRQDALYLPPTVHRHPVFYEESRGINLHWCDICRRRIVSSSTSSSTTSTPSPTGCYRCSLCDFDICLSCAKRDDAATVGENLLRGDAGVREEQVLDNKSYFRRSWVFVKPQLCLLSLSLVLLTCSSISKLALPHFQGRIIDKVIPDEENGGDPDHDGFLMYIRIYVIVMVVQGAVTTMYSAIFTLVSRRLKFNLRNSLFER